MESGVHILVPCELLAGGAVVVCHLGEQTSYARIGKVSPKSDAYPERRCSWRLGGLVSFFIALIGE